jgi:hypothetical protein
MEHERNDAVFYKLAAMNRVSALRYSTYRLEIQESRHAMAYQWKTNQQVTKEQIMECFQRPGAGLSDVPSHFETLESF